MLQLQEEDCGAKEWRRREGPEKLKKPKVRESENWRVVGEGD